MPHHSRAPSLNHLALEGVRWVISPAMAATTLPPSSGCLGNQTSYQQLVLGAPRIERRRGGEPPQLLLGQEERSFTALQSYIGRHEVPHFLANGFTGRVGPGVLHAAGQRGSFRPTFRPELSSEGAPRTIGKHQSFEQGVRG